MSFKRRYLILISIIFFLVVVYFVFFFLTKNYILPNLLKKIGIKEFKEVKLSPLFNQIILLEGKSDFFNFGKAEIRFSPLTLLRRKFVIKKFIIEKLVIEFKEKEETKIEKGIAFVLPLFLKEIEIKDLVFQDLNLKKERLELKNLKINLKGILKDGKITGEIKEVSGEIFYDRYHYNFNLFKTLCELDNEKILLTDLNLVVKNSSLYGEINYHWQEKEWRIKIDSALLNLRDFTNYEGKGRIKGNLVIKNSKYNGKIDVFFQKAKIVKEWEDIKMEFNFLGQSVSYQLTGKILGSSFKSKGKFDLRDFSYDLIVEIFNLENLLPFKIEKGKLEISGKKLSLINFIFDFNFHDEKIYLLKGKGNYQNNKISIKNLVGKGKELSFSLRGEADKERVVMITEIFSFPLEVINNFLKKEIKGIIKGKGEIVYEKSLFSIKGEWEIRDFYFLDLAFKDLNFSGNLALKERIDWEGEIRAKGMKAYYLFFDSLKLSSSLKDFQLMAFINNSLLKIAGNLLSNLRDSLLFSLEKIEIQFDGNNIVNSIPAIVEIKDNCFKLKDFNLRYGEGEFVFNLVKEKDILTLASEIKNFVLENLFLIGKKKEKIGGRVSGEIFLTYDLKNKHLNQFLFDTKILDFHFQDLKLDSIEGELSLAGETIIVKNIFLFRKNRDAKISGFFIFDFTKRELVNQNLTIELNNFPSDIIIFIPEILIAQEGEINGKINLGGNLKNPKMIGKASISGGEIILKIPETKIKDVSAQIIFSNREIIFPKIWGKGKEGEVFANGFIRLKEFFKVETLYKEVKFHNMPITYQKDFMGLISGDVSLSLNEKNYLKIVGNAEIKEGLITVPFGIREERRIADTLLELLELDLTFRGERNIWLRNKNADVELGVDFNLKLKNGEFIYSGKINTKQGYLYYLGRSLQLKEGEIVFENISYFDPKISLIGFLTTKPITYQNRKERFKIFLEVSGYLSNPNFNLYSDPPYLTQEEIISYLGLSFTPEELKNWEEKDIFLDILQDRILSYFERETSERLRKYIGLDYFRLESSFRGEPYLRLSVGKYLSEKLYFSYTHSFIEEKQDVFRAEYYLSKNQQIIGERNEFGKTVIKYLFYFRF